MGIIISSSHVSGYFWIRNLFFPDSAAVHTYSEYPAYESTTFWSHSPERKCLNTLWIQNRVGAETGKCTVNIQDGAQRNVIAFFKLQFQVLYPTPASIMPHGGLTFWTFFPYRTDECHELDAGNKLWNERSSALWDNFVSETFIEEDWRWNFRMSRTSLYKLADELRVNPNTCGRANSIWIQIRVDVETFESSKKNLRIEKYQDTFGRGLSHRVDRPIPNLFMGIPIPFMGIRCPQLVPIGTRAIRHFNKDYVCMYPYPKEWFVIRIHYSWFAAMQKVTF